VDEEVCIFLNTFELHKVFAKKRYVKNNTNHNSDVTVESRTESTDDIQAIELSSDDGFKMYGEHYLHDAFTVYNI
jgi:hypothetical protein